MKGMIMPKRGRRAGPGARINGAKLRQIREGRGESTTEVSKSIGIDRGYLSRIERDLVKKTSLDIVRSLGRHYGVSERVFVISIVPPEESVENAIRIDSETIDPEHFRRELIELRWFLENAVSKIARLEELL